MHEEAESDTLIRMPPQNLLENFSQVSAPLKRKLEEDAEAASSSKRRSLEPDLREANYIAAPSSDDRTAAEKLQCAAGATAEDACGEAVTVKKATATNTSYLELAEDDRSACAREDSLPPVTGLRPCAEASEKEDMVATDLRCMQELAEGPRFDSILAKTLLAAREADRRASSSVTNADRTVEEKEEASNHKIGDHNSSSSGSSSPRVVVEHQPVLPAIYELGQILTMRGQFDSQDDEEEEDEDVVGDSESDDDEDDDDDSSMFDTPPKQQHFDRFWPTTAVTAGGPLPPAAALVVVPSSPLTPHTAGGLLTPPASPQLVSSSTTTTTSTTTTYQFLDQTSQRIECDENGKSYLQLGTVSHHHLPVTPVIQPKPVVNLSPSQRRTPPLLSCRPLPPRPPNPTPPCDHHHHQHAAVGGPMSPASAFLRRQQPQQQPRRRCSSCYRQQRSDMLSLSLHKLHSARQRSDSSLRRSVLICNMLRYIEDESTVEHREEQEAAAAAQQLSFHHHHHHHHHNHHHLHNHQDQAAEQQQQSYWANHVGGLANFVPPPTPNPYRDGGSVDSAVCGEGSNVDDNGGSSNGFSSVGDNGNVVVVGFDAPLKDFNSAFRQTPIPPSANTLLGNVSVGGGSSDQQQDGSVSVDDEDRSGGGGGSSSGINWSSVLSLSSQAELDPLNNNTYTDSHHHHHHHLHHGLWTGSMSGGGGGGIGSDITDVDLSHHSFDDISWKLSPISADEVLKAFPEENLFQCAA